MIIAVPNLAILGAAGRSACQIYWRFISGFGPIVSSQSHAEQIGQ
jgi:hypothetical protein